MATKKAMGDPAWFPLNPKPQPTERKKKMSLPSNTRFAEELQRVLEEAKLPADPKNIIGHVYQFQCEHGSHHHILVGTVLAIEVSDEGGLSLHVSNPRFWGVPLVCIVYTNGKWLARVDMREVPKNRESDPDYEFFSGAFSLL